MSRKNEMNFATLGLHGNSGGQQAACSAAFGLATAAGCAPPPPTSSRCPLEQALGLHGSLTVGELPGKASERAAGLRKQAHGLAAQGSSCCTPVLHRVQLHLAAATALKRSSGHPLFATSRSERPVGRVQQVLNAVEWHTLIAMS